MNIRPISLISKSTSSKAVVAEFLSTVLNITIDSSTFRKSYQHHFQSLLKLEENPVDIRLIEEALNYFQQSFVTENNQTIPQALHDVGDKKMTFLAIRGSGSETFVDFGDAPKQWVRDGIAEPGIVDILTKKIKPTSTLLALAAGAECAPTKAWLGAGGRVVAVMRSNPARWQELIQFARTTAGELIIPMKGLFSNLHSDEEIASVAGIDFVSDLEYMPHVLSHVVNEGHTVIGAYAYSPGASHLIVQAVQDALVSYAAEQYAQDQVAFHWLATPTDSQLLPNEFQNFSTARYSKRSVIVKVRDVFWKVLGQLRPPRSKQRNNFVVVDSSVQKQGFNYQCAKRTQRLRAHLLHSKGFPISYGVTPPATTDSVLRHRILIASYRGAPRFGLHPFDKDLIGSIAMQQCLHMLTEKFLEPHEIYSKFAVHGGLWRLAYDPQTVWIPATVSGLLALLLPKNRAFRSVSLTKR